jgi:alkyl hydroperoxide reductase subunit AhpF
VESQQLTQLLIRGRIARGVEEDVPLESVNVGDVLRVRPGEKVPVDGVFVQIGLLPNSGFAKETLELTKFGEIVVDVKGHTSVPGIYAAGDVTTVPFKQIVIAMGEGAKAALACFEDRMKQ